MAAMARRRNTEFPRRRPAAPRCGAGGRALGALDHHGARRPEPERYHLAYPLERGGAAAKAGDALGAGGVQIDPSVAPEAPQPEVDGPLAPCRRRSASVVTDGVATDERQGGEGCRAHRLPPGGRV